MNLREVLSVLSKSSSLAVTTQNAVADDELLSIKKYLHVKTDIETAFEAAIQTIKNGEIIFLCGSSGDGKSEILTRYSQQYKDQIDFHLDATHSFDPSETAIDALNKVFNDQLTSSRPLVIGINIGMLANFEQEGSDHLKSVKTAITKFLTGQEQISSKFTFLDFEAFPKFTLTDSVVRSDFFSSLIDRVVIDDSGNRFNDYLAEEQGMVKNGDETLVSNFFLLRDKSVQKIVVELLLNARIKQDQFITARMLLDFIYCILTAEGYLFDNLFNGGDNELLSAIAEFDPSIIRNPKLDKFILHRQLKIEDEKLAELLSECEQKFKLKSVKKLSPKSLTRLSYLLRNSKLTSNYLADFKQSFECESDTVYRNTWRLHKDFDNQNDIKKSLREFYDRVVFKAIANYANRNAEFLGKDEFYISTHGQIDLAAEAELSVDYKKIMNSRALTAKNIHSFDLFLRVNDISLNPISMNANLMALMLDVVKGFRPNKHEQNSVVLLDELVSEITELVSKSDVLNLFKKGEKLAKVKNIDNGEEIRVSGFSA